MQFCVKIAWWGAHCVSIATEAFFQYLHVVLMENVSFSELKYLPSCSLKGTVAVYGLAVGLFWAYSELILYLPGQEDCWMCSDFSWTPCLPWQSSSTTFSFEDLNHLCPSSFAKWQSFNSFLAVFTLFIYLYDSFSHFLASYSPPWSIFKFWLGKNDKSSLQWLKIPYLMLLSGLYTT